MKIGLFFVVLLALSMGTAVASETKLGASNIEKLKNFAVEMLKGPKTCHVCQTIEKTIDFDLALFFLDWKPAATAICTELSKKYKMSEQNCFDVIKRYIVGLKTSFYRLEIQARSNFFCGYIFGLCHIDKIEKISVKPIIEALYKDQPAPQDPVPTGRSTIKILQFTDPHLDSEYQVDSIEDCTGSVMCCRKDSKPRDPTKITKAGIWGSHGYGSCDLPIQTFDAFLRFAKKEINPDIILWTGDNEHHEIDQVTQKYNYDITKYIADKTKATFPDKRIQFAIGNHEHFPVDNLDMVAPHETKGIWFYDNFTSAYQSLLSENQLKDFKTRGFYSEYFPEFNIRFINLLSAPMETMNFYLFVYKFDPTGQFQYMWDTLREAEKNGEHVFISVHIPPGGDGTHQLFDELFNDTVERFRNNIRGIFSGHTHIDELKWTRERADNSKIVHTNFVAGSLTTFGGMQPAFRVFEVDKDTGVIVDMIQYRLDLDKWNTMDPTIDPVWDVIYSFKTDYLMTDMSRASMQQLYDNLMNDRQPYLNKYFDHLRSGKPNSNNWKLKKLHLDSNDNLGLHCDFNTEVREYTKCLGWKLFTDYKSDWADIFVANMWTHYMKFN